MELAGIEIVFVERCAIRKNVFCLGNGLLAEWHIIAMYEIGVGMKQRISGRLVWVRIHSVPEPLIKVSLQIIDFIPAHSRHLVFVFLRLESLYIYIKDSDAIYVTFFRMAAQELLSYTNAQDGLLQVLDYLIKLMSLQIFHCFSCLALSWEENAVSLLEHFCIICKYRFDA